MRGRSGKLFFKRLFSNLFSEPDSVRVRGPIQNVIQLPVFWIVFREPDATARVSYGVEPQAGRARFRVSSLILSVVAMTRPVTKRSIAFMDCDPDKRVSIASEWNREIHNKW